MDAPLYKNGFELTDTHEGGLSFLSSIRMN
jgi:hypothetical protein